MNAGLGNLDDLKTYLLAAAVRPATDYDAQLLLIGKGVAALLDRFCNRNFAYLANDQIIFTGDRPHYYLPRFPFVESAGITVEMRYFLADAWADISGQPLQINPQTGLLHFGYTLGRQPLQVRVTYTGGYWFNTLEPADAGYPQTLPTGATALPDDVKFAWLTQCAEVWKHRDKLGQGLTENLEEKRSLGNIPGLNLLPLVRSSLQTFVRYQLT